MRLKKSHLARVSFLPFNHVIDLRSDKSENKVFNDYEGEWITISESGIENSLVRERQMKKCDFQNKVELSE
jgi:hypothetical protein